MAQIKRNYQPEKTTGVTASAKPASLHVTPKKTVLVRQPLSTLFTKDNYRWMAIGAGVIILGMLLMMGGKNKNPDVFDYSVVYSTMRITVAPIVILAGLMIEVYAIFKNPKTTTTKEL
ncbi:MAG: DUF3098 domain-containing protein [Bacteroidota bacterium]|nr:DUF3098 domain-containing protein [Bacteroidota bacterium]